jgi:hypothetical protein
MFLHFFLGPVRGETWKAVPRRKTMPPFPYAAMVAVEDWGVQSPWPESEVVVDGNLQPVSAAGTFRVYLTDGKVHQIRRREEKRWQLVGFWKAIR